MKRIFGNHFIGLAIIGMALWGNGLQAQPNVKVSGYVNAPEENKEPVRITVVSSEGEVIWQKEKAHPSMTFKVPASDIYDITFEQPGSLTKTVQLDTRHAVRSFTKGQTRPVNFEVIMEPVEKDSAHYAGPVGKIDFSERTGRMDVEYDYSMERVAEHHRAGDRDEGTRRQ